MPSNSYGIWNSARSDELDEIAATATTQQGIHAYVLLLSAQFQGFCRELHVGAVDHYVDWMISPAAKDSVKTLLVQGRQLDSRNPQPGCIGADFGRFGLDFWDEVRSLSPQDHRRHVNGLELMVMWRNIIAHSDFKNPRVQGQTLSLPAVEGWRATCDHFASAFDEVMRRFLETVTGRSPW